MDRLSLRELGEKVDGEFVLLWEDSLVAVMVKSVSWEEPNMPGTLSR